MIVAFTASEVLTTAWLGVAAGLAVAIPLGPIGLLIIDRGMVHGRTVGLAAAGGVATTDLLYAVLALTATAWAARVVEPITTPLTYLAATVLAVIAIRGLLHRRRRPIEPDEPATLIAMNAPSPARTFMAFAALTAINPGTVLYFTALTLALTDRLATLLDRTVFLMAVGASSLAWQTALATLGSRLGRTPRASVQIRTQQASNVVLLALATLLAYNAA